METRATEKERIVKRINLCRKRREEKLDFLSQVVCGDFEGSEKYDIDSIRDDISYYEEEIENLEDRLYELEEGL